MHKRAGQRQLLLHPTREVASQPARELGHTASPEQLLSPRAPFLERHLVQVGKELEVLGNR